MLVPGPVLVQVAFASQPPPFRVQLLIGVQVISMGLVGELVTRTYFESQGKRAYAVRSTLNVTPVAQDPMASRAA